MEMPRLWQHARVLRAKVSIEEGESCVMICCIIICYVVSVTILVTFKKVNDVMIRLLYIYIISFCVNIC